MRQLTIGFNGSSKNPDLAIRPGKNLLNSVSSAEVAEVVILFSVMF